MINVERAFLGLSDVGCIAAQHTRARPEARGRGGNDAQHATSTTTFGTRLASDDPSESKELLTLLAKSVAVTSPCGVWREKMGRTQSHIIINISNIHRGRLALWLDSDP